MAFLAPAIPLIAGVGSAALIGAASYAMQGAGSYAMWRDQQNQLAAVALAREMDRGYRLRRAGTGY